MMMWMMAQMEKTRPMTMLCVTLFSSNGAKITMRLIGSMTKISAAHIRMFLIECLRTIEWIRPAMRANAMDTVVVEIRTMPELTIEIVAALVR